MRYTVSKSGLGPRARSKFYKTFSITILLISTFAALSIAADRSARYFQENRHAVAQRRAQPGLDVARLLKKDEEVCQKLAFPLIACFELPRIIND